MELIHFPNHCSLFWVTTSHENNISNEVFLQENIYESFPSRQKTDTHINTLTHTLEPSDKHLTPSQIQAHSSLILSDIYQGDPLHAYAVEAA